MPIGSFLPTHLRCWFHERGETIQPEAENQPAVRNSEWTGKELALYEEGQPVWLEHPMGSKVDLVAIPITNYEWEGRIHTANGRKEVSGFNPMCGDDCYIVGYPEGFIGPLGTPMWKRASIASEPELNYDDKPMFLADSMTRPGMSGSPVFARISGLWGQEGAQISIGDGPSVLGFWSKFIGVYAGREGDEKVGFQLARIWKSEAIEEIIASETKAIRPEPKFRGTNTDK